jgi:hypothetical protein
MLKTVRVSSNKKTGPIAVTYRSGEADIFGTCPQSCGLLPCGKQGASEMDAEYLRAVVDAVPRNGVAWTYSHFSADQLPMPAPGKTVINASCDTMDDAVAAHAIGRPAVVAAPVGTEWKGGVIYKGCNSCNALQNCRTRLHAWIVETVGHCVQGLSAIMSWFLLPMVRAKNRSALVLGGVMARAGRWRYSGAQQRKKALQMMQRRRSILRGRYRLALCCAITLWEIWVGLQRDSRVCSSDNFGLGTR